MGENQNKYHRKRRLCLLITSVYTQSKNNVGDAKDSTNSRRDENNSRKPKTKDEDNSKHKKIRNTEIRWMLTKNTYTYHPPLLGLHKKRSTSQSKKKKKRYNLIDRKGRLNFRTETVHNWNVLYVCVYPCAHTHVLVNERGPEVEEKVTMNG